MGRIKSVSIKTLGNEIMKEHASKFTEDFENNKKALGEIKDIESKKIRNILAGYITSEMKRVKKTGI